MLSVESIRRNPASSGQAALCCALRYPTVSTVSGSRLVLRVVGPGTGMVHLSFGGSCGANKRDTVLGIRVGCIGISMVLPVTAHIARSRHGSPRPGAQCDGDHYWHASIEHNQTPYMVSIGSRHNNDAK